MNEAKYTMAEIKELADALGLKHDVPSVPGYIQQPHGYIQNSNTPGLFTRPGGEPDVFSAIRRPTSSLISRLLVSPTVIMNPEYDILSGVDDGQGTNPTNFCGDPAYAGLARLCTTRSQFGEWFTKTETITLNQVGGRINRGDIDRVVVNNPTLQPFVPDALFQATNPNTTLGLALFRLGIFTERQWAKQLYTGIWGDTSVKGFIKGFDGFDRLIKTGHLDIETGLACTAADSIIVDRAGVDIGSGTNVVHQIGGIIYKLERRAKQTGLDPITLTISMHPDLFEALVRVWPLSYYTENITGSSASTPLFTNSVDMERIRDDMRMNFYLPIRGKRYPVELDDAITLTASGNGYKTDVYFIPEYVQDGTRKVTYIEPFDQNNTQIQEFVAMLPAGAYRTSNGGLYAMTNRQTGFCFDWLFASQPRLVMRTPWLAAKWTNVGFSLDLYQDDPYTNGQYYVNGGRYSSRQPYTYA